MNLQGNLDPVTNLINQLSSGQELRVKLQTETDNIFRKEYNHLLIQPLTSQTSTLRLDVPKIEKFLQIFSNRRSPNFPTQGQKYLLDKMKHVPVYTVVNGNDEVIMASPRSTRSKGSFSWLREKYNEIFNWTHDEGPITLALFFMHKEDAESYMHEICKKEPRESEFLGLKVKTTGLDKFYRFNRTSPPKIQSRLIGDLNEIDKVVHLCKDTFFYNINPKQRYSKTWFQGNPVYILKFTQMNGKKVLSEYNFHNDSEKKVVFFNKEDAIRAWKVYINKQGYNSYREPNLEIYNLESLLNDLENTSITSLLVDN